MNVSDVSRALEQLDEIHARIARGEVYRGWRSVPVALSGLAGLVAAWWQPSGADAAAWTRYWIVTAAIALVIGCAHLIRRFVRHDSSTERRRTLHVLGQFLPALAAGAALTFAMLRLDGALVSLFPGLWALCFAVGIAAARPYLPQAAFWVAAYFAVAGVALLWLLPAGRVPSPWLVGGIFGAGQTIGAAVLYWSLERDHID